MAAIDFPASPTTGQLFSAANGVTYRYDGTLWLVQAGPGGGTGDVSSFGTGVGLAANTWTTLNNATIITGNSGGWLSAGRYTPPAGRYRLTASLFGYSTAGAMLTQLKFRKNGVDTGSVPVAMGGAANIWVEVFGDIILDANGTDWFDVQGNVNPANTSGGSSFSAFPLTGMQGPPGPLPSGAQYLYNETVLGSAANAIACTIPANCKRVEFDFATLLTAGTDTAISVQLMQGATPIASGYTGSALYGNGTTAGSSAATTLVIITGLVGVGTMKLYNNNGNAAVIVTSHGNSTTTVLPQVISAGHSATYASITGARIICAASTFRVGSYIRSFVVT